MRKSRRKTRKRSKNSLHKNSKLQKEEENNRFRTSAL
jgi:hypothetical protein